MWACSPHDLMVGLIIPPRCSCYAVYLIFKPNNNRATISNAQRRNGENSRDERPVTKKQVKQMLRSKLIYKFKDSVITAIAPSWTGSVVQIELPAQGTGESDRVGDSLGNVKLRFRGSITNSNVHLFRFIVFQWLDINSTIPAIGYILNSARSGTVDFVHAPLNETNKLTYKILYDQTYSVSASLPQPLINFEVKAKDIDMQSASSVYASSGSLYFIGIQDGSATLNSLTGYFSMDYTESSLGH